MRLLPATKSTFGKVLKDRLPILKSLVTSLIQKEQIVTTKARALAIRPIAEKIIENVKANKSDLREEVEAWTVDHRKTLPLLYGPLRARYANHPTDRYHTRVFNLLHREYRHAEMAVIELVNGPRDTLQNLEKYKKDLEACKSSNENMIFEKPVDQLMMNVKTTRHGRMHEMHKRKAMEREMQIGILKEAGKEKCKYIMECFAKNAIGEKLNLKSQPEFWVR